MTQGLGRSQRRKALGGDVAEGATGRRQHDATNPLGVFFAEALGRSRCAPSRPGGSALRASGRAPSAARRRRRATPCWPRARSSRSRTARLGRSRRLPPCRGRTGRSRRPRSARARPGPRGTASSRRQRGLDPSGRVGVDHGDVAGTEGAHLLREELVGAQGAESFDAERGSVFDHQLKGLGTDRSGAPEHAQAFHGGGARSVNGGWTTAPADRMQLAWPRECRARDARAEPASVACRVRAPEGGAAGRGARNRGQGRELAASPRRPGHPVRGILPEDFLGRCPRFRMGPPQACTTRSPRERIPPDLPRRRGRHRRPGRGARARQAIDPADLHPGGDGRRGAVRRAVRSPASGGPTGRC